MGKLDGKVAIVTGSGRGLGRAFAIAMAKEGCSVVVNSVDPVLRSVEKTTADIKRAGGKAISLIAGVGTKETAEKLVNTAVKEFGTLHILINNAGQTRDAMIHKMEEEQWDDVLLVHLRGTFLNTQAAVRYMIDNKIKGRIINITSSAGIFGNIGQSNYCAAKAGMIGLTKSNAKELVKYGICINAIAPLAKTDMFFNIREDLRNFFFDMMGKKNVLQKAAEPSDVAPTIVFLASDDGYFVTGQVINVTGSVGEVPWD